MSLTRRICIFLLALVAISERAWGQLMQLDYRVPTLVIESPADKAITFLEQFEYAFKNNSTQIFSDRFHSLNTLGWYLESNDQKSESFGDLAARTSSSAFSRSAVTGFREAVISLPVLEWLDSQKSFMVDLLLDSLATEEEEAVAPLDPSFRVLERSWWKRLSESRGFRYGIRPFQLSPYAFASTGIWSGGSLLAMAHLRYHYRRFSEHQFEFALSVPLTRGVSLDIGSNYQFGRHAEEKSLVLKFSKQLRGGGIVHVGMEVREHPTFLVGMSVPL